MTMLIKSEIEAKIATPLTVADLTDNARIYAAARTDRIVGSGMALSTAVGDLNATIVAGPENVGSLEDAYDEVAEVVLNALAIGRSMNMGVDDFANAVARVTGSAIERASDDAVKAVMKRIGADAVATVVISETEECSPVNTCAGCN